VADWQSLRSWSHRVAGLELTDAALDQLRHYVDLLQVWNRKISLVGSAKPAVVLDKHVADSLIVAARCRGVSAVADLGSGAGFPGLVIALLLPATRITLIEARGKKVSFLEEVRRVLKLGNVEPIHGRVEAVGGEDRHRGAYDLVTSRALADIDHLQELAAPFLRPGGRLLAMRSVTAAVPEGAERFAYTLPDGTPRMLTTCFASQRLRT
jgi:16S rRNA (guanine527-N7)-methyltransferase